jgi:hypothetical protein
MKYFGHMQRGNSNFSTGSVRLDFRTQTVHDSMTKGNSLDRINKRLSTAPGPGMLQKKRGTSGSERISFKSSNRDQPQKFNAINFFKQLGVPTFGQFKPKVIENRTNRSPSFGQESREKQTDIKRPFNQDYMNFDQHQ